MKTRTGRGSDRRLIDRCLLVCFVLLMGSSVGLAAAALYPIGLDPPPGVGRAAQPPRLMQSGGRDVKPLLRELAGRRLIRPAQVQAAVKDDGTADELLKMLKLQGVVQLNGRTIAYIAIANEGVKVVEVEQRVLEFLVEAIEPGNVTLSLNGVIRRLRH